MTTEQVLKVSTLEAVQNVTDLKNNITELKRVINGWKETTEEGGKRVVKTFQGLTIGSDEYKQAVQQLQENQAALRNAMSGTAASLEEVKNAAKATGAEFQEMDKITGKTTEVVNAGALSYNELVRTLAKLKEEWRATEDEATREEVGKKINAVNNSLKKMDASVGVYSRNVGMYANVVDLLGNSFTSTAGGASGMINPIKGATAGLKALSATPVIAILGILANILDRVIKALKSSEEGMESVSAAFGAFSGIGDTVTAILQKVGEGLGWLSNQFVKLLEKLGLVNDKMKEKQEIALEEIRIAKEQREATMRNAEAERDIAELRAKAADRDKYSTKERIAFLEEASRKEEEIAARSKKAAEEEYELIKRRNALTKSSAEALKAEAEAYAKMIAADTNYQNAVRRNTKEINAVRKQAAREAQELSKAQADAVRERLGAEKEYLTQELSLLAQGTQERLDKQKELRAVEYELAVNAARLKIKNAEELNAQLLLLEQIYDADIEKLDRDFARKRQADELLRQKNELALLEKNSAAYLAKAVELRQAQFDALAQLDGESEAEYQARVIEAQDALRHARLEYDKWLRDEEALEMENRLTLVEEDQFRQMENEVALREWQLEKVREYGRLEGETEAQYRARELAAEKAFYDARKKQRDAWISSMASAAGAVSGLLGSIADMYESNTSMTEAEARRAKNLRIASATIDMFQGAVTAYAGAQSLGVPLGPIVGGINAAAVIATGLANIAKIRATEVNKDAAPSTSGAASVPAIVTAPAIEPVIPETRTITGASDEERLTRMTREQRVYILSSDLEADREQMRTRIAETTF